MKKEEKLRKDQEGKREAEKHLRRPRDWGSWCHGWELTDEAFTEVLSSSQSFASTTRQLVTVASLKKTEVPCHGLCQCLGCPQGLPSTTRRCKSPRAQELPHITTFIPSLHPEASFKGYLRGPWKTSLWPKIHETPCIYKNTHTPAWKSEKLYE